jgi:hypothetical protein
MKQRHNFGVMTANGCIFQGDGIIAGTANSGCALLKHNFI